MLYKDVIKYVPIETLVQLNESTDREKAKDLVSSYVISDEMSDRLTSLVVPQLQYDEVNDNKGLLIVGNYGTGKSHLLSVIASICEDATLLESVTDKAFKKEAAKIAGKFKLVIRTEIGSSTMPLRKIIISQLEEQLRKVSVNYAFPSQEETVSHKRSFEDMMLAFHETYPDDGLLIVVDEL